MYCSTNRVTRFNYAKTKILNGDTILKTWLYFSLSSLVFKY